MNSTGSIGWGKSRMALSRQSVTEPRNECQRPFRSLGTGSTAKRNFFTLARMK
jgi:hypothetical protein